MKKNLQHQLFVIAHNEDKKMVTWIYMNPSNENILR